METQPKVVVVVLNWNNWQDTLLCIESVFHNGYSNYQVIVADNDSQDGSLERVKAWAEGRLDPPIDPDDPLGYLFTPPIEKPVHYVEYDRARAERAEETMPDASLVLIQTGDNLGYAGGNNVATRYVSRRDPDAYVLILNNDAAVPPNFLESAMNTMSTGPGAGVSVLGFLAYWYYEPDRLGAVYMREKFSRGPVFVTDRPKGESLIKDVMVYGGAMLISPDAPVKMIPEEYFLYCEDMAYCKQIFKHGGTIAAQLDNFLYERGSRAAGLGSPLQIYYTRRNKLAYSLKYYSKVEYGLILARMTYSTLVGCLGSAFHGEWSKSKAYLLALVHHLQGKMGRTWTQN